VTSQKNLKSAQANCELTDDTKKPFLGQRSLGPPIWDWAKVGVR